MDAITGHGNVFFEHSGGSKFEWMVEASSLTQIFSLLNETMGREFNDYLFFVFSQINKTDIPEGAFFETSKKKILIILSDESESIPYNLSPYFFAIFKCFMQFDKFCVKNIFNFPLGCDKGAPPPASIIPITERRYSVFFSGALHIGRAGLYNALFLKKDYKFITRCLNYMIKRPRLRWIPLLLKSNFNNYFDDSFINFTKSYRQGLGGSVYGSMIAASKIAFCPRGCVTVECSRQYEAMRAGCIVISAKLPKIPFYRDSPIIQIDNWREGLKIADSLLKDENKMEELSRKTQDWWERVCSEKATADYMLKRINSLSPDSRC
jgi:hypothetical protein